MHELGVVFYIADSVEKIAKENGVDHVRRVTLELGEVSTVIPDYLIDVWKWNSKKSELFKDCALTIERISAVTFCTDCQKNYSTVEHGKICPFCGSENTYLVTGNELMIKEIEVDE